MNLDELTDAVLRRLEARKPLALLLGQLPQMDDRYRYVQDKPYETVVIGILPPGELLQMPSDAVCRALLDGIPVWLWPQPYGKGPHAAVLRRELLAAEQRLIRLGARPVLQPGQLVTAGDIRQWGKQLPLHCRLTPLARDILEGKDV